jgi:CHAT domain-containing protein/TPR repeat protein
MFGSEFKLIKPVLVSAFLAVSGAGSAQAGAAGQCRAAAQPMENAQSGVIWKLLDAPAAIAVCQQALQENPSDHASTAFLARAHRKAGNKDEAARLLLAIADTDDPDAMAYLSVVFHNGMGGVPQDLTKALNYAQRSAAAGNSYAMYRLVLLYEREDAPFRDMALSQSWLDQAIALGNGIAMEQQGDRLYNSDAEDQAFHWYVKAVEHGNPDALYDVGWAYRLGQGVEKDLARAAEYFARGSALGYGSSSYQLGKMHLYGWGVAMDDRAAIKLFELARAQGREVENYLLYYAWNALGEGEQAVAALNAGVAKEEPMSLRFLGSIHFSGRYVDKDFDKAIDLSLRADLAGERAGLWAAWYWMVERDLNDARIPAVLQRIRDLATDGDAGALEVLGHAYEKGRGVPRDYEEAARLYQLAIDAGDDLAPWRMARLVNWGALGFWDPALGASLMADAAAQGHRDATISLAELLLDGTDVPRDIQRARYLLMPLANDGNLNAQLLLGRSFMLDTPSAFNMNAAAEWLSKAAEGAGNESQKRLTARHLGALYARTDSDLFDAEKARHWYGVAVQLDDADAQVNLAEFLIQDGTPEALRRAAALLIDAMDGGGAEEGGPAQQAADRLEAGFANTGDPLHAVLIAPDRDLAAGFEQVGRAYEEARLDCTLVIVDCGRVSWQRLDLARAAEWYRRAGELQSAQLRLGRLLLAHPQYQLRADEGRIVLRDLDMAAARLMVGLSEDLSMDQAFVVFEQSVAGEPRNAAAHTAALAAIGRYGDEAIAPGWRWLEQNAPHSEVARVGQLSVLTFLGAFDDAAGLLEQIATHVPLELADFDYSMRKSLTYLMLNLRKGARVNSATLDGMENLLNGFERFDPDGARQMLRLLDEVRRRMASTDATTQVDLRPTVSLTQRIDRLQGRIQRKSGNTGFSPMIIPLYLQLSSLQAEEGQLDAAKASVYQSIAFARAMHDKTRHLSGSLEYHLEMSCWLQKGSNLLFSYGEDTAGLTLAKAAVNELQLARVKLAGLPQDLQSCFRESISEQYRKVAELLIRYGHFEQAQWALDQLKDLETYRYSGRDQALAQHAFAPMPMTKTQTAMMQQIHGLPLGKLIQLRQELAGSAADDVDAKPDDIALQLEQAQSDLADSLDALSQTVQRLGEDSQAEIPNEISARSVRRLGGRLKRLDGVAMVYSVSLQDTHFLVISGQGTEHREIRIGRNALEQSVGQLRKALSDPRSDPFGPSQAFYNTIWSGVEEALDATQAQHVLLSLDGVLRNVPVAALHDGQTWLMGRREYVVFTSASRDLLLDDEALTDLRVEAFGASQGGDGFSPLPFVRSEVANIVQEGADAGSRVWLDNAFDEQALSTGMGSGASVVHVATHFHLTQHQDSSRMLLGNGQTLSVGDLKARVRNGQFYLADVHMMVLSACQTALTKGSELESLAATLQWEGVRSVVATLWPVADRSTSVFMTAFYENLRAGHSRSRALREAQKLFVQSDETWLQEQRRSGVALKARGTQTERLPALSHPFYWAGFQLIGQWR